MSEAAIEVKGLGKRFEIGDDEAGYLLLTETIMQRLKGLGRRTKPKEFWALRNIDFEVKHGETLGIIGHNGAGKSTLLKILSRITSPTEGEARLRGRVGALLEVGTGFHPELTGRENVFLNGAILSMGRQEIRSKFEEIVEFADIGPFIDTPVKRYSSGMKLRLAFSVAAHLEPEILIIDEVLSVGDLEFQQKCLGRMEDAAQEGRTVVFISHNLSAVRSLCDRALLLSDGRVMTSGDPSEVIDVYVGDVISDASLNLRDRQNRHGNGELLFTDIRLEREGVAVDSPTSGEDIDIVVNYETADGRPARGVNFGITIGLNGAQEPLVNLHSQIAGSSFADAPGEGEVRCRMRRCPLPGGQYYLTVLAERRGDLLDQVNLAAELTVIAGDFYGSGKEPPAEHRAVMVDQDWSIGPTTGRLREGGVPLGGNGDAADQAGGRHGRSSGSMGR